MIHISPWSATTALFAGAKRVLPQNAPLYLYGPYRMAGEHTPPSNAAFDRALRGQNREWGVRDLERVVETADAADFELIETVRMPANNLSVIFRKRGAVDPLSQTQIPGGGSHMATLPSSNKQWRLASYPDGLPTEENWTLSEGPMPTLRTNQILVRAIYLDVAPYMRGRISPEKNYAAGVAPGDLMLGGGIGEVVQSNSKQYKPGDVVVSDFGFGWQEYAALAAGSVRAIDPKVAPLPYWMEAFGLNGLTAYFALLEAGRAKAGDTVVISAAAGSVGQLAGQIAKLAGCRAVGITSSPEKAAWCREIGYDDIVNYRESPRDLPAALAKACPRGVDLYVDNTAGIISDAVMQNLAAYARVVLVGSISLAGRFGQPDIGPRFHRQTLIARATIQGFLVGDYQARYAQARERLTAWYKSGVLRSKFDIAHGIESMPGAFLRLLASENVGKQLVQVGDEPK
jgi:hypothetical protein